MPETREGTWDTLKMHPMTLMRMVVKGEADVIGKDDRGRIIYRVRVPQPKAYKGS